MLIGQFPQSRIARYNEIMIFFLFQRWRPLMKSKLIPALSLALILALAACSAAFRAG